MQRASQATDGELLAAVVAGDGEAFAAFYRRHLPAVVAFLLRFGPLPADFRAAG